MVSACQSKQSLQLTDAASAYLLKKMQEQNGKAMRFSIESKGCSGQSYCIEAVKEVNAKDETCTFPNGLAISLADSWIPGIQVDYVSQGLGSKKLVFKNPNAKSHCGCGESFN